MAKYMKEQTIESLIRKSVRKTLKEIAESKRRNNILETKIRNLVRESLSEFDDDEEFWKQEQDDELNYEMGELTKAMQKANNTYHAKSSDGNWETGDNVIIHGRTKDIEGVIKDFDINFMTYEETCDVDYDDGGQTKTMIGVPLSKISKAGAERDYQMESLIRKSIRKTIRESVLSKKMRKVNEEWYPQDDDDIQDYYVGLIMKLDVNGVFDDLSPEKVKELQNVTDEYIESENSYCSVMVRKINLVPDGFDGYDVSVEVAVSAPNMPTDAIEEEVNDAVWYYIEEKTGVRSPNVSITDEEFVFDRRL